MHNIMYTHVRAPLHRCTHTHAQHRETARARSGWLRVTGGAGTLVIMVAEAVTAVVGCLCSDDVCICVRARKRCRMNGID